MNARAGLRRRSRRARGVEAERGSEEGRGEFVDRGEGGRESWRRRSEEGQRVGRSVAACS
jgi:hypothetical protein